MSNNEQTSKRVGTIAAKVLAGQKATPAQVKTLAGAVLTQRPNHAPPKKK